LRSESFGGVLGSKGLAEQPAVPVNSNHHFSQKRSTGAVEPLRVVNLGVHPSPASFFLHLQKLRSLLFKLLLHLGNSFLLQSLAPIENFAARNRTRVHIGNRCLVPDKPSLKSGQCSLLLENLSPPLLSGPRIHCACSLCPACSSFPRRHSLHLARRAGLLRLPYIARSSLCNQHPFAGAHSVPPCSHPAARLTLVSPVP
jgi:hypothetical protein